MPTLQLLNTHGVESPQTSETLPGVVETGHRRISVSRDNATTGHPIHVYGRTADAAFQSGIVTGYCGKPYTSPNLLSRTLTNRTQESVIELHSTSRTHAHGI